jgi:Flp pilus assembly protein TadG
MFRKRSRAAEDSRGQSLVETALLIPLLLMLILNAINFGYFLLVTLNLTSATRDGIEYAVEGSSTPANGSLPAVNNSTANDINSLINQELGHLNGGTLGVQVCSLSVGTTTGSPPLTTCATSGTVPTNPSPDPDPEWQTYPGFALNRVDIWYKFQPIIPATPFSLAVLTFPACSSSGTTTTCTFARHAEMRAMGS